MTYEFHHASMDGDTTTPPHSDKCEHRKKEKQVDPRNANGINVPKWSL